MAIEIFSRTRPQTRRESAPIAGGAEPMRIAVIGSGYVGLVAGACLAHGGHRVTCIDKNPARIADLNRGVMPIYEPGLADLIAGSVEAGRLDFTTDCSEVVPEADVVLIAVGTPARPDDGRADLSFVYAVAAEIAPHLEGFTVVVTKSTVPVGTGDEVERIIRAARPDADVEVGSNPEFLREGAAIADFQQPDRIVVGANSDRATDVLCRLYALLFPEGAPTLLLSRRTAELTKYATNAFLATKVSFINEMADLCERVGADVREVARGMGADRRIGPAFLRAGPGYGGSCFPKDTLALISTAQDNDVTLRIVETVVSVNENRKRAMADKVIAACGGSVRGRTIALLGLTFKPDTDDLREAPALSIAARLRECGAEVRAYDPQVEIGVPDLAQIVLTENAYECVRDADAAVVVTEWNEFRTLDLDRVRGLMKRPLLIDLRNVFAEDVVTRHGLAYLGVGTPSGARGRLNHAQHETPIRMLAAGV